MQLQKNEILVVDDELLIRDLLYDFFTSHGYTVHLAENGGKVKKIIEKTDFQIAIVDLKMPVVDGLQVTTILRQEKPYVPVIIMTAYPSMDSAIEAIRKGVFDYIVKPFKMTDLFNTVKSALDEYKLRVKSGYAQVNTKRKNVDVK